MSALIDEIDTLVWELNQMQSGAFRLLQNNKKRIDELKAELHRQHVNPIACEIRQRHINWMEGI